MRLATTNFKARLIALPRVRKTGGRGEFKEYGNFTLNKKYRVYAVYAGETSTQFLVADNVGTFMWIGTEAFKG